MDHNGVAGKIATVMTPKTEITLYHQQISDSQPSMMTGRVLSMESRILMMMTVMTAVAPQRGEVLQIMSRSKTGSG